MDRETEFNNETLASLPMTKKLQNLVYLTFLLIGVGLLWPWNNILSATLFFQNNIFNETTTYAKIFTSSMMTVSTLTSLLYNIYLERRQYSYVARVARGLIWQFVTFLLITLSCAFSKSTGMDFAFIYIMILISISAISTAWTQNGIMAIANVFGPEYSQSVMMGQAVAGVLPSVVLLIVSIGKTDDDTNNGSNKGIYFYFLTTSIVCVSCLLLFYNMKIDERFANISNNDATDEDTVNERQPVPFSVLYSKLKYLVLSIITTFIVTLIFPVFGANIFVTGLPMSNVQFIPLIFTMWNLGDLAGRFIANWRMFRDPAFTPYKIFVYSIARIAFIPFFFYFTIKSRTTNEDGQRVHSAVLDLEYILLQFLFGVTNGHIISMSFMKVPESLSTDQEKEAAGGFTSIFVSTGLTVGSIVSYVFAFMISNITKE
ncbi:similar to Saccharomyces cerevisiae YAL022C FUN26 Vacuolar membrane transporter with broad nucleoside selectivity [Maudiozyma saulgeensis]|uniref:Similar to Saccharomyces cerevisiae YAL022C FUN26 Vacuolar membrane transporter with broad nucleoside selectivity n=1 Tax=Maudiozyma saulgeensis TaxID=1789683 RepID=A0A1X7R776_9SACH|nr:similar to Saccharomyces cerevisiae YAL022C FUN26 Vacuolar membrane transporter with broad nucleoside selectivity [Kazachstania saulgeensis]